MGRNQNFEPRSPSAAADTEKNELPGHWFNSVAAYNALLRSAQQIASARRVGEGRVEFIVSINGQLVTVRGIIIHGVLHITTEFVP